MKYYIEDHPGYGLGNFISCTPTIKSLYERDGEKVNVLFTKDYVKQCYIESPYINHIDKPEGRRLFGSDLVCKANDMRDIDFIHKKIIGSGDVPSTFIDEVDPIPGDYGVFINGSGSDRPAYLDRKIIPVEIQYLVRELSPIPVYGVGSMMI
jgi:hypothetical protein